MPQYVVTYTTSFSSPTISGRTVSGMGISMVDLDPQTFRTPEEVAKHVSDHQARNRQIDASNAQAKANNEAWVKSNGKEGYYTSPRGTLGLEIHRTDFDGKITQANIGDLRAKGKLEKLSLPEADHIRGLADAHARTPHTAGTPRRGSGLAGMFMGAVTAGAMAFSQGADAATIVRETMDGAIPGSGTTAFGGLNRETLCKAFGQASGAGAAGLSTGVTFTGINALAAGGTIFSGGTAAPVTLPVMAGSAGAAVWVGAETYDRTAPAVETACNTIALKLDR